jgi:hypothetical protein
MAVPWRRAPLAVFLVALAVRTVAASSVIFPIPEGSAYYVAAAQNLATGRGLVVDLAWSYATPPLVLPRPAFDLWQPLASLIAAPFTALTGSPLVGAQIPGVLLGALAAPLAWAIAGRAAGELGLPAVRGGAVALTAGLLVALAPLLVIQAAEPDSSVPFTLLALAACWWMPSALAERPPSRLQRVVAGTAMGLAYLARQEALALVLAYVALAWWMERREHSGARATIARVGFTLAVAALVVVPWLVRQASTWQASPFGQALENAWFSAQTDVFAWAQHPTLASYLDLGLQRLVELRLDALVGNVLLLLVAAFPASVLGLIALATRPRSLATPTLRPLALVAGATFVIDVLVFPVAGRAGLWSHGSGPAIVLLAVGAALVLDRAVARVAVIRRWRPPTSATGRLALLGPLAVSVLTLPVLTLAASFEHERSVVVGAQYGALAAAASRWAVSPGPVITDHPMWLDAALDRPALALPREAPAAIVGLARHFAATAVVARDPDAIAVLALLATYREDGVSCFLELPAPPPFRALAFLCSTELASRAAHRSAAGGPSEGTPYTGPRAVEPLIH